MWRNGTAAEEIPRGLPHLTLVLCQLINDGLFVRISENAIGLRPRYATMALT